MKLSLSRSRLMIGLALAFLLALPALIVIESNVGAGFSQQSPTLMTKDYFLPVVSKAAVNSFTLIDWDLAAGKIDLNQATTYKIYALFQSPLLPTQYLSDVPLSSDSSGALYSTLSNWGQLNANTQQTLTDFLTPQVITSSGSSGPQTIYGRRVVGCDLLQSKVTTHFIIWYSGIDPRCASGVTDVYVANLATGFEDAWTKYYTLGYTEPVTTNVYLVPLIKRITNADAISWPLGIFFDHDLSDNILNLQAIAAHEFFHQVQLQYFAASCPKYPLGAPWNIVGAWVDNEDVRWWMESTAQWAQHEVYTSDKSYFRPIPSFLNQTWQHLDTRLIFINVDPKGLAGFPYGTVLFPIYLSERLPAQGTLIKNTWEKYSQLNNGCGAMMPALQSALQTQGTSMELVFPGFSEANYSLAYQNQNDFRNDPTFGVGASYKPWTEIAALWEDLLFQHGPTTGTGRDTVEHLGTAYIELDNRFSNGIGRALTVTADIYLSSSLTTTVDPVVKVWAINQYTPTIISKTIIPNFQFITQTGSTKHYVAKAGVPGFDGSKWVTMMLVNTQTSGSSLTYTYSAGVVGPAVIYAATDNGGFDNKGWISKNGGASWISYTFPTTHTVRVAAAVTNTQGLVGYFGTDGPKLWKTTDGGQTFTMTQDFAIKTSGYLTNPTFSLIQVDPNNSNTIYVGLTGSGQFPDGRPRGMGVLFKSTDGGATFGGAANDADLLKQCHQQTASWASTDCIIKSLAVDPINANTLWIGQAGDDQPYQAVMRSTDGGMTWVSKRSDGVTFAKIALSPLDSNVLWVFTVNGSCSGTCIHRTSNAGSSWLSQRINDFPFGDNLILADSRNVLEAWADSVDLKRTTDGNSTWQTIFAQFSFRAASMLGTGRMYGAPGSGMTGIGSIQWSTDDGASWFSIGDPGMAGISSSMNPPLSVTGYGGGIIPNTPARIPPPKNPLYP